MTTIRKDNIVRMVVDTAVPEFLRRGYEVIDPRRPETDAHPGEEKEPSGQPEPVEMVDISERGLITDSGLYVSQLSTVSALKEFFRQVGIPFTQNEPKASLLKKRDAYIAEVKANHPR